MSEAVKAVIFDLDGTLLDTLDDLTDAVNAALEHYQLPVRSREEVRSFVGNGIRNLMQKAVGKNREEFPAFEELFVFFQEYYRLHCERKTKVYDGIYPLLQELKDRGIAMAIVSNKFDAGVKALHRKFFADYMETAIGEREGIRRKPAADAVNEAIRLLGVEKAQTLYVGDSEVDIQTAENAGLSCISVTWGFKDAAFLEAQGAKHRISSPKELLDFI